jgi:hypothetical protein
MRTVTIAAILALVVFAVVYLCTKKNSNNFYRYIRVYPFLDTLKLHHNTIKKEATSLKNWVKWPNNDSEVFPFYGNGQWYEDRCKKCPTTYRIVSTMPGIKTATLYRRPKGNTSPYQTYAYIANNTLRCNYCIAGNGTIIVEGDTRTLAENDIVVYDHSKNNFKTSKTPQIILVLDFSRPSWVKKGNSKNTKGTSFMGYTF